MHVFRTASFEGGANGKMEEWPGRVQLSVSYWPCCCGYPTSGTRSIFEVPLKIKGILDLDPLNRKAYAVRIGFQLFFK